MFRKLGFVFLAGIGLGMGQMNEAAADHNHCFGGYSSYRPPVVLYGVPHSAHHAPTYGWYTGRPLYSGGYPGNWSYYGSGYGSSLNAPWGGYGATGFPRYGSYGMGGGFGPGFSYHFGR